MAKEKKPKASLFQFAASHRGSFLKPVSFGFPRLTFHEADYLVKTDQMVNKKIDFGREIITLCGSVVPEVKRKISLMITGQARNLCGGESDVFDAESIFNYVCRNRVD